MLTNQISQPSRVFYNNNIALSRGEFEEDKGTADLLVRQEQTDHYIHANVNFIIPHSPLVGFIRP